MQKNIKELTDDEAYAIENGDLITDGTNPPPYEIVRMMDFHEVLGNLLSSIGYYNYLVENHEIVKRNILNMENLIISSIDEKSYLEIMDLLDMHKSWLERELKELWTEYYELDNYVNNIENQW